MSLCDGIEGRPLLAKELHDAAAGFLAGDGAAPLLPEDLWASLTPAQQSLWNTRRGTVADARTVIVKLTAHIAAGMAPLKVPAPSAADVMGVFVTYPYKLSKTQWLIMQRLAARGGLRPHPALDGDAMFAAHAPYCHCSKTLYEPCMGATVAGADERS